MEYITVQGDMLDKIAKDELGSEKYLDQLMAANPQHCGTVVFPSGVRLVIPEVDDEAPVDDTAPPWRDEE